MFITTQRTLYRPAEAHKHTHTHTRRAVDSLFDSTRGSSIASCIVQVFSYLTSLYRTRNIIWCAPCSDTSICVRVYLCAHLSHCTYSVAYGGTISQRLPVVQSGLNLSIVNTSTVSTTSCSYYYFKSDAYGNSEWVWNSRGSPAQVRIFCFVCVAVVVAFFLNLLFG